MNRITISWIFLIVISMFFPASAIMYASGATDDNSDDSSTGGGTTTTMDNNGSSTSDGTTMDNNGSSTSDGTTMDNNGSSTGGGTTITTDNSTTLPTTSTGNNNTENTADLVNSILTVHNRERAAVGVPPLIWNDTLAADARTYAQYLADTGKFEHPTAEWVAAHPMSPEGENLAGFNPSLGISAPGEGQSLWVAEKKDYHGEPGDFHGVGHYTQMVWKNTKQVGCGTGSGKGHPFSVLSCRYTPPGNVIGQKPY